MFNGSNLNVPLYLFLSSLYSYLPKYALTSSLL